MDSEQVLYQSNLDGDADGWTTFTPREDIAPGFSVEGVDEAALKIELGGPGSQGKWLRRIQGVEPGACYRLTVLAKADRVASVRKSVYARLIWLDGEGRELNHANQEYFPAPGSYPGDPADASTDGCLSIGGRRIAPEGAAQAELQLIAAWAPGGTVRWSGIELARTDPPEAKTVTVASVFRRPQGPSTVEENIEQFCEMLDRAGEAGADLCVLPEALTVIGVPDAHLKVHTVADTMPGRISAQFGERAKKWNMYVVACYPERDGDEVFNSAVLIGRDGNVVGVYRKTHLPNGEVDAGYSPGGGYPVFETDFGKVGMMICWDVSFPECARALALSGARLLLMPIWGGNETLMKARAIENAVYLVSSSYDAPTGILDPLGAWMDMVRPKDEGVDGAKGHLTIAEVDLTDTFRWGHAGDFARRMHIERRPDLAGSLAADGSSAPTCA